jgi:phosphoribosylaminoimidazolecarboxamide formyltransferase/IMP cyclohydrolase
MANKNDYTLLESILTEQQCTTSMEQRRMFAIKAFDVCTAYDTAISNYFHQLESVTPFNKQQRTLRYGENLHQQAAFLEIWMKSLNNYMVRNFRITIWLM